MAKNIFWFCDDPKMFRSYIKHLNDVFDTDLVATASAETIQENREIPYDLLIVCSEVHSEGIDRDNKVFKSLEYPGVSWLMRGIEFTLRVRQGSYIQNGFKPEVPIIFIHSISGLFSSWDLAHPLLKEHYRQFINKKTTFNFQEYLTSELHLAAIFEEPFSTNLFTHAVARAMSIEIEV